MAEPVYEDEAISIYNGESLTIIPELDEVDAIITDPPYSSGGAFRSDRTKNTVDKYVQTRTAAYRQEFAGDNRDQRSFLAWTTLWLTAAYHRTKQGGVVVCFIDWRMLPTMTDAIQAAGWVWRGIAVWDKGYGRPTPGRFSNACEYIVWGSKGPMPERDAYPPGIFRSPSPRNRQHITQKPESVMAWLMEIVPPGAVVLDPFTGSGTTLKAAKETGRRAIGIEVDASFCEIAAKRCAETLWLKTDADREDVTPSLFEA